MIPVYLHTLVLAIPSSFESLPAFLIAKKSSNHITLWFFRPRIVAFIAKETEDQYMLRAGVRDTSALPAPNVPLRYFTIVPLERSNCWYSIGSRNSFLRTLM